MIQLDRTKRDEAFLVACDTEGEYRRIPLNKDQLQRIASEAVSVLCEMEVGAMERLRAIGASDW